MDFRQLQYVLKVAECGSITKAASELYITQPSLSNYISKVEKELGVLLFDRSVNPIQLSLAGEEYVKDARRILRIQEQMKKKLDDISSVARKQIRLGISYERGIVMLPYLLPKFKEMFPQTEIHITPGGHARLTDCLDNGKLDMIIFPLLYQDNTKNYYPIYQEELLLCAGPEIIKKEHLLPGRADTINPSVCQDLPFIRVESGRSISEAFNTLWSRASNIVLEAYSISESVRLAAVGYGACLVPRMTLDAIRINRAARLYSIGAPPLFWEVYAITRKGSYLDAAEQAIISIMAREFGSYTTLLHQKSFE